MDSELIDYADVSDEWLQKAIDKDSLREMAKLALAAATGLPSPAREKVLVICGRNYIHEDGDDYCEELRNYLYAIKSKARMDRQYAADPGYGE